MSFTIVPYDVPHRDAVVELLRIGLREEEVFAARSDPPEDDGFFATELREHLFGLEVEPQRWLVAVDDRGSVVGLMWKSEGNDRLGAYASVRQIIVAPHNRRRGVGTSMLAIVEAEARDSGAVFMLISAFRSNPACRLYRSLGFTDFPDQFKLDRNPNHVVLWKCFRPDAVRYT